MNSSTPRQLLLTAADVNSVRQQLGLSAEEVPQPLDLDQLPISPDLRHRIADWAAAFVELHGFGGADAEGRATWAQQGIDVASALAGELHPDVALRYVGRPHHCANGVPLSVAQPIAGLFEDVLRAPIIAAQDGWTAYQSVLTLEFGRNASVASPPAEPWLTATRTDVTDAALRDARTRAIDPVVRSLLTPAELATCRLIVYQPNGTREISVWLAAMGEEMRHWIHDPDVGGQLPDIDTVAQRFADSMEDWVCETTFAWGEQRRAVFEIPPRRTTPEPVWE